MKRLPKGKIVPDILTGALSKRGMERPASLNWRNLRRQSVVCYPRSGGVSR